MSEETEVLEFSPTEARGWLRILPFAGDKARAWAESFSELGCEKALERLAESIPLIRQRRFEEAHELLRGCASESIAGLRQASPSLGWVLDCWYLSAEAYLHYCRNDTDRLFATFEQQKQALALALEAEPFLVVLAGRFCDIELQKARVFRNLHRWDEVQHHLEVSQEMIDNSRPLHRTSRQDVFFSTIDEGLQAILRLDQPQKLDLTKVLDPRWRRSKFRAMVLDVYALPWMLIPFG